MGRCGGAVLALCCLAAPGMAAAQASAPGVYTEAQAARGEVAFRACSYCHGRDMRGGDDPPGPALKGRIFLNKWGDRPLAALFGRIVETMPRDRPGTLAVSAYADILAHILQANGLPPGAVELPADPEALRDIRLDPALVGSR